MKKDRRKFDANFKLEVARMIKVQVLSVAQVCQTMGIGETAVRRWATQYEAELNGCSGIGNMLWMPPCDHRLSNCHFNLGCAALLYKSAADVSIKNHPHSLF